MTSLLPHFSPHHSPTRPPITTNHRACVVPLLPSCPPPPRKLTLRPKHHGYLRIRRRGGDRVHHPPPDRQPGVERQVLQAGHVRQGLRRARQQQRQSQVDAHRRCGRRDDVGRLQVHPEAPQGGGGEVGGLGDGRYQRQRLGVQVQGNRLRP